MNTATLKSCIRSGLVVFLAVSGMKTSAQIDCLGVDGGSALPGAACDDDNPLTMDDIWYPECYCLGQCPAVGGDPCDDMSPFTINDVLTPCGCTGTCVAMGEQCDDLNPYTSGDVYWPTCYCHGTCTIPAGAPCDDGDPTTTGDFMTPFCNCTGVSNMISGQVFLDLDQDGVFNGSDVPLPGRTVQAGPANRFAISGVQGNFNIVVPSGTYTLVVTPGSFEVQAQAPPLVDVTGQGIISSGHALAMNALSMEADLAVYGGGATPAPGFYGPFRGVVLNEGTIVSAASTLVLTFDPLLTFVAAGGGATVAGNMVSWDLPALAPGEGTFREFTIYTPPGTAIGTPVQHSGQVTMVPPDNVPANDVRVWQRVVTNAWDPNDKQVFPSMLTPEDISSGEPVEYMIRFQNTGTASAQNVRVTDQLPTGVDPSSFQFIGSSHSCHTNYRDGVLEFLFDDIMLPDSNANEPESHGFVMFRIKPMSNLLPGDSVWNRAYIYFDFNEAVVTNAATFSVELNTAVTPSPVETPAQALWPNPTTDLLNIPVEKSTRTTAVTIIDMNGRVVRSMASVAVQDRTLTIPVADLADGLYTLRIGDGLKAGHQRFVKSH